jgi:uncharacterized protein
MHRDPGEPAGVQSALGSARTRRTAVLILGAFMPDASRLEQLEDELFALGEAAMLVEELDGFIAGLLVCPEMIQPSEWLPIVFGVDGSGSWPDFEDLEHANRVFGLIMDYYNGVVRTLMERADNYSPLFPIDDSNGEILWEIWIEGFERAVELRPTAWQSLLDGDVDTAAAMRGMLELVDLACGDPLETRDDDDALSAAAPENIARWVVTLNAWRLAHFDPTQGAAPIPRPSSATGRKVGRNDPCPCGSGRKYKRCCGLH